MPEMYDRRPYDEEAVEHLCSGRPQSMAAFMDTADMMADAAAYIRRLERELIQERASRRWYQDRAHEGLVAAQEQSGLMFKAVLAGMVVGGRNGQAVADAAELLMPAVETEHST